MYYRKNIQRQLICNLIRSVNKNIRTGIFPVVLKPDNAVPASEEGKTTKTGHESTRSNPLLQHRADAP